jgi:hypothetical protein
VRRRILSARGNFTSGGDTFIESDLTIMPSAQVLGHLHARQKMIGGAMNAILPRRVML